MTSARLPQLELDTRPDLRARSRAALKLAIATLVVALAASSSMRGGVVFLIVPLAFFLWVAIDLLRCQRLYVSSSVGRIGFPKTERAWTRQDVLAVRTSSSVELAATGTIDDVSVLPAHGFELALWTRKGAASDVASNALERATQQRGDQVALDRARTVLGASDLVLVRSRSPAAVLDAARAVVHALGVPWLHEGVRGLELRLPSEVDLPLSEKARAASERMPSGSTYGVRSTAGTQGHQLSWDYSRAAAMTGVALLMLAIGAMLIFAWLEGDLALPIVLTLAVLGWLMFWLAAQHGTYALEVRSDALILSGVRSHTLPIAELLDVEARLDQRPALCLVTRTRLIELPTGTPAKAVYAAHALVGAIQRKKP